MEKVKIPVGTRSILFGAHCFLIHPWFVALAWYRLYGFPWDPRLWVAFFVHDLGYWGKPNMDGPEGKTHPELGGRVMHKLFDKLSKSCKSCEGLGFYNNYTGDGCFEAIECERCNYWGDLTVYHSRSYARKHGMDFSKLCVADKLAIALTPAWLYIPLATLSGEIEEYMADTKEIPLSACFNNHVIRFELQSGRKKIWFSGLRWYMRNWVKENNRFVSINTYILISFTCYKAVVLRCHCFHFYITFEAPNH